MAATAAGAAEPPRSPICRAKLAPRTPIPLKQKQNPQPLNTRPLGPCGKKTRYLPDLCLCHGCGLRCSDKCGKSSLRALKSQWRVLLLCPNCLRDLRSGTVCSYCFSCFSSEEDGGKLSMACLDCRRRVHLTCLPRHRDFVVPADLDPKTFVCVDCRAVPTFLRPAKPSARSEVGEEVDPSLEDVLKNANYLLATKEEKASKAKEKALEKELVARSAIELARGALDLVSSTSKNGAMSDVTPPEPDDEELALQLHRIINGSRRILRNHSSPISSKTRISVDISSSRNFGATESSSFALKVQGEIPTGVMERGSDKSKDNAQGANPVKGEQGDNVDSISLPSDRSSSSFDELGLSDRATKGGGAEDASATRLQTSCNTPDRYSKKYFRNISMKRYGEKYHRKSWMGNPGGSKDSQASCSMFLSSHSRRLSNTSKNSPNARRDFIILALEASENTRNHN